MENVRQETFLAEFWSTDLYQLLINTSAVHADFLIGVFGKSIIFGNDMFSKNFYGFLISIFLFTN